MKKLLLFALPLLMLGCRSDDSKLKGDGDTSGVAYIRGKMNGTSFDYTFNNTADDTFLYNAGSGFAGEGFDRWYYYGGDLSSFTPPEFNPAFYISWNNVFFGEGGDESGETAAFYNSVQALPSNFLTSEQDNAHMPGVDIDYVNASGVSYSSKDGSQAGSTISIAGSSVATVNGLQTKTVWGTFNCKLYNYLDTTDVITVTNGSFKLILSEYN